MTIDATDLRRRMARMTDGQLLDIVTIERRAYRQVALDVAAEELHRRGLSAAPAAALYQRSLRNSQQSASVAPQPPPQLSTTDDGLALACEIVCAAVGSIILAVVFVAGRETQKAVLRWATTSFVLPYTVWRGARLLDRRWQSAQTGQATN